MQDCFHIFYFVVFSCRGICGKSYGQRIFVAPLMDSVGNSGESIFGDSCWKSKCGAWIEKSSY